MTAPLEPLHPIRLPTEELVHQLDALDATVPLRCPDRRKTARHSYRAPVDCWIDLSSGKPSRFEALSRNLSRSGICLLIGQFAYAGAPCRIGLVTIHNRHVTLAGRVVRCRYVPGTAWLYEAAVQFEMPINVRMFQRDAAPRRTLLVAEDAGVARTLKALMKIAKYNVHETADDAEAVQAATERFHDVLLVDIDSTSTEKACDLAEKIRASGGARPLLALTESQDPEHQTVLLAAGFDGFFVKPLSPRLIEAIAHHHDRPLRSDLEHKPEFHPPIRDFVNGLTLSLRDLENSFGDPAGSAFLEHLNGLQIEAEFAGYLPIARAAGAVLTAIKAEASVDELRNTLDELSCWCMHAVPPPS